MRQDPINIGIEGQIDWSRSGPEAEKVNVLAIMNNAKFIDVDEILDRRIGHPVKFGRLHLCIQVIVGNDSKAKAGHHAQIVLRVVGIEIVPLGPGMDVTAKPTPHNGTPTRFTSAMATIITRGSIRGIVRQTERMPYLMGNCIGRHSFRLIEDPHRLIRGTARHITVIKAIEERDAATTVVATAKVVHRNDGPRTPAISGCPIVDEIGFPRIF